MTVKTKKCKCGAEVVKLAKVCPECGKKFMSLGKKILIAFGVIVVLAVIKPGSGGDSTPTSSTPTPTVSEKTEQIVQEKADASKISDSDKVLLKKSYSTFDNQQQTQFAEIKEKYKNLSNAEVADINADFIRLSNEEVTYLAKQAEEEKKQAEAKAIADKKAVYQKWVEDQFSVWDGSNRYLVDLLKENLNDPKSFDHEETTYKDMGDYLIIKMTYRAKNGFGGLILQNVTAKSDYKTNVISIISQNN